MENTKKNQDMENISNPSSEISQRGSTPSRSSRSASRRSSQNEDASDRNGSDMQNQYSEYTERNQNQSSSEYDRFSNEGSASDNHEREYASSSRDENFGAQPGGNRMGFRQGQNNYERAGNASGSYNNQMSYGGPSQSGYRFEAINYGSQARNRGNWNENYRGQEYYDRAMSGGSQPGHNQYGYDSTPESSRRSQIADYASEGAYRSSQYDNDAFGSSRRGNWSNEGGDYGSPRSRGYSNFDNMRDQDIYDFRGAQFNSQRGYGSPRHADFDQREYQGGSYNQGEMNRYNTDNFGAIIRGSWGFQDDNYGSISGYGNRRGNFERSHSDYGSQGYRDNQFDPQWRERNASFENRSRIDYDMPRGQRGYAQESRNQGEYNDANYGQSFSRESEFIRPEQLN